MPWQIAISIRIDCLHTSIRISVKSYLLVLFPWEQQYCEKQLSRSHVYQSLHMLGPETHLRTVRQYTSLLVTHMNAFSGKHCRTSRLRGPRCIHHFLPNVHTPNANRQFINTMIFKRGRQIEAHSNMIDINVFAFTQDGCSWPYGYSSSLNAVSTWKFYGRLCRYYAILCFITW